jgi:hypothetical protein
MMGDQINLMCQLPGRRSSVRVEKAPKIIKYDERVHVKYYTNKE